MKKAIQNSQNFCACFFPQFPQNIPASRRKTKKNTAMALSPGNNRYLMYNILKHILPQLGTGSTQFSFCQKIS